ncbi:hypothetical protein Pst134EA_015064 [Puccinia striiformis f. sp. tritici]|uniref:Trehalose 6-phosphate phosphatase n=1 Tax=Puccinia striiformis f. sp. tritici PST-78 TaxID=1165861 RepID=A0A0L0VEE2_9BASI|nr:hypothetical protein Pst134EA_015064 [Puccinia striiformis f. sp. tritici]KAH9452229.1 hypothetical protein Pst134EB_016185 [Puccinia striiformis f. sp. tritici]KAH9462975.1 hypothetical protein Pst134EA_015064 [Puccinia striiformis f. sp. tritici]KAI9603202.1 hypothetical protein H4Q26_002519 [Puccinia striiformis f. sp. tritici PST-130]KNE97638.1 hypothetical protein PSTG_09045 [Puccinia striiformis f. sp. tritici PST-78]
MEVIRAWAVTPSIHQFRFSLSTMSRLILSALALLSLLPATFAAPSLTIQNEKLFGLGVEFNPTLKPSHFLNPGTERTVGEVTEFPLGSDLLSVPEGKKRLIVADNDGVLIDKEHTFEKARALLIALAADPQNEVWVNSARSLPGLTKYLNIPGVNIASEHGTILIHDNVKMEVTLKEADDIRAELKKITEKYESAKISTKWAQNGAVYVHDPNTFEEMKPAIVEIEAFLKEKHPDFIHRQEEGKAYGEIKHKDADKGNFVDKLIATGRYYKAISLGDQATDEGMHIAMNLMNERTGTKNFHSVIVSSKDHQKTYAAHKLNSPKEVHEMLEALVLPVNKELLKVKITPDK